MNRIIGSLLALTWIIAMAALVQRDVLPLWTAQEAPNELLPAGEYQVGILSAAGARLGTTWITAGQSPSPTISSTTLLEAGKVSGMMPITGSWLLGTDLAYDAGGRLDHFHFTLSAPGVTGEVDAERIERDFSVLARLGDTKKSMLLDGELSKYLSETLRPFTHLAGLRVGQSWRIRLLDPLALIRSGSVDFQTILARVTQMDIIEHRGGLVRCFRVESPTARAWADSTGRVLRQEVQLPLVGKWTLVDEPVDVDARRNALRAKKAVVRKSRRGP